jgi:23S rRNA pseudouridine2605 synthase
LVLLSFFHEFAALKVLGFVELRRHSCMARQRLERILSNAGVGSRREVAALFKRGRIRVNGAVVRSGGALFDPQELMPGSVVVAAGAGGGGGSGGGGSGGSGGGGGGGGESNTHNSSSSRSIFSSSSSVVVLQNVAAAAAAAAPLLAAYHKPLGVVCTMDDRPWHRPCLGAVAADPRYPFLAGMHPVGRLDADTTGLMLWSSDGVLTQRLLHPGGGGGGGGSGGEAVPREYEALVLGGVSGDVFSDGGDGDGPTTTAARLAAVLRAGVRTSDGVFSAELLAAELSSEVAPPEAAAAEPAAGGDMAHGFSSSSSSSSSSGSSSGSGGSSGGGSGDSSSTSWLTLRVSEGKYRMVRRILHNAGHSVLRLHRRGYGDVRLGGGGLGGDEEEEEGQEGQQEDEEQEEGEGCRRDAATWAGGELALREGEVRALWGAEHDWARALLGEEMRARKGRRGNKQKRG